MIKCRITINAEIGQKLSGMIGAENFLVIGCIIGRRRSGILIIAKGSVEDR
jgi:hypothetical protein